MTRQDIISRIEKLKFALRELTDSQIDFIEYVVNQFRTPFIKLERHPDSDLVNNSFLNDFGDVLRIHHCFSRQALSKDRFEYALEKTLNLCGKSASLATSRTNRGHDITIEGTPCSLKTQADNAIKEEELHISKFMELGKGKWPTTANGFSSLRDMFMKHMQNYERIFTLRCLSKSPEKWWYELVEIPKNLLEEANNGHFEIKRNTSQTTMPGYCRVKDGEDNLKFELYFDAGSERKLQIRHLQKKSCILHATWIFSTDAEDATKKTLVEFD